MKLLKKITLTLCLLACLSTVAFAKKTTINGKIENNKFSQIDVQLYSDDKTSYGNAKINADGSFKLSANVSQTDIFKLVFDDGQRLMVCLSPNQQIELVLDANNLSSIISVKGSPSIEFCKKAVEMTIWANPNRIADSINKVLQADKEVQFYNEFQSQFKPFLESNSDADEYCGLVAQTTDSLQQFVNSKIVKGKIKNIKDIDVFIYTGTNLLREIATNYSKYATYMQSMNLLNDFTNNRNEKFTGFYEVTLDKYLEFLDKRNQLMKSSFSDFVNQIQDYLMFRDSLQINDVGIKKKEKEVLAAKIIALASLCNDIETTKTNVSAYGKAADGYGKYAMQEAQRKVSTVVQNYQKFFDSEQTNRKETFANYLLENKSDLAVLMFLDNSSFPRDNFEKLHKEITQALYEKYPKHPVVVERHKAESSPATSTSMGSMAPEIAMPNSEGKILKLSDLRGKIVLLDFWAGWCRPCRMENPNVVKAYKKYHDKGFEVFSVSIDRDRTSWLKAIEADGLIWPNHVSDLNYWQTEILRVYGVSSVPSTFLIGKDGKIIARNLRGAALENKLKELLD